MTTYIFVLLGIIIVLLVAVLMKRPTIDISALREDNARLRERLAERLGALSQNAIELKNISGDIANFIQTLPFVYLVMRYTLISCQRNSSAK